MAELFGICEVREVVVGVLLYRIILAGSGAYEFRITDSVLLGVRPDEYGVRVEAKML